MYFIKGYMQDNTYITFNQLLFFILFAISVLF